MTAAASRNRYVTDNISTASPARLLVMLYDRLVLDVQRGEDALRAGEREAAHTALVHAQDIVMELHSSLRVDAWDGGPGLAALYGFLHGELIAANIAADADRVSSCRALIEPLAATWREAAMKAAATTAAVGAPALGATA